MPSETNAALPHISFDYGGRDVWHTDCPGQHHWPPMKHLKDRLPIGDGVVLYGYECTACRVRVFGGVDRSGHIVRRPFPATPAEAAPPMMDEPFYRAIHEPSCDFRLAGAPHPCTCAALQQRAERAEGERDDDLELAWGIIANASGGDWTRESPEWQEAAVRWRDRVMPDLSRRAAARAALASPAERTGGPEGDLKP